MEELVLLGVLYMIGLVGWVVFRRLNAPSPALLGSLAFIGVLRAFGVDFPTSPTWFVTTSHILLGVYLGSSLTKKAVRQIRKILVPAGLVMVWAMSATLFGGSVLSALTDLDLKTGILSASIGGITEMVILSMEINADTLTVVILQTFRVIVTMSLYPLIVKLLQKKNPEQSEVATESTTDKEEATGSMPKKAASLLLAIVGGLLFSFLGVPAGAMIGSLLFMVAANMLGFGERVLSDKALGFLLIAVGISVSDSINPAAIQTLFSGSMLTTLFLTLLMSFISSTVLTIIVHKITRWDWVTCILACAPAGLSTMPLLAIESNLDPIPVSLLHLSRLFMIKASVPLLGILFA